VRITWSIIFSSKGLQSQRCFFILTRSNVYPTHTPVHRRRGKRAENPQMALRGRRISSFHCARWPDGHRSFKAHSVDAVILDYNMPKMDGIAVAEMLKKLRSALPIIMLSGYPVPAKANRSIDAIIIKGEAPARLLTTTASLLNIRSHSHIELDGRNIAFVDEQRRYLDVTDGVCELLGYTRSELLSMRIDDVTGSRHALEHGPPFSAVSGGRPSTRRVHSPAPQWKGDSHRLHCQGVS
jgi:CheY-like chemotaxis protein